MKQILITIVLILLTSTPVLAQGYTGDVLGSDDGVNVNDFRIQPDSSYLYSVDFTEPTQFILRSSNCRTLQELVIRTNAPYKADITIGNVRNEEAEPALSEDQVAYGICSISATTTEGIEEIGYKSRIRRTWISDQSKTEEDINLYFVDNNAWVSQDTREINRSATYLYLGTTTDSFKDFMTGVEGVDAEVLGETATDNLDFTPWIIALTVLLCILLIIGLVSWILVRQRQQNERR